MARRKEPRKADHLLDQLLAGAEAKSAFAKDGLLDEFKEALAERALNAEMDHHLDQESDASNTPATAMAARPCRPTLARSTWGSRVTVWRPSIRS